MNLYYDWQIIFIFQGKPKKIKKQFIEKQLVYIKKKFHGMVSGRIIVTIRGYYDKQFIACKYIMGCLIDL